MHSCADRDHRIARTEDDCPRGGWSLRWIRVTLISLSVSVLWVTTSVFAREVFWERLADGLEVAVWEPGSQCGDEVPPLFMLNVDPERFRFSIYHFRDEGLSAPVTIQEWHQRTRASVLFNAGLFGDDYSYLGLLFKDGRSLGTKRHPQWKALFVAEPMEPGQPKARVLDLAAEPFATDRPAYREVAQSLMLLDRAGQPRVRRTGKQAHQTVVAEDRRGRILVIKTAEIVALWELAECLRTGLAGLRHAMAMDGGASSDLLIGSDLLSNRPEGSDLRPWQSLVDGAGMRHIALPAVIGVRPRTDAPASR